MEKCCRNSKKEKEDKLSTFCAISELELELELNNRHRKEVTQAKPFSASFLPQNKEMIKKDTSKLEAILDVNYLVNNQQSHTKHETNFWAIALAPRPQSLDGIHQYELPGRLP